MALMDSQASRNSRRRPINGCGWGSQFSPNGKWVSYQSYERTPTTRSTNISIIDVATKENALFWKVTRRRVTPVSTEHGVVTRQPADLLQRPRCQLVRPI